MKEFIRAATQPFVRLLPVLVVAGAPCIITPKLALAQLIPAIHMSRHREDVQGAVLRTQQFTLPPQSVASSHPPFIEPEVRNAIARETARVLVELRIAGGVKAEGELANPEAVLAQRAAIAAAQASVLSRLAGTQHSLTHRFVTVPFLALEIGAEALTALETMADVVERIVLDVPVPPTGRSLTLPAREEARQKGGKEQ